MRCPGSGPSALVRDRVFDRSAGVAAGLRSLARADRRLARLPSPSEPARGEPVDRREVCCCRADPEGFESPLTPHRVLLVPEAKHRPISSRGEKTWSPGKRRGDWVGTVAPGQIITGSNRADPLAPFVALARRSDQVGAEGSGWVGMEALPVVRSLTKSKVNRYPSVRPVTRDSCAPAWLSRPLAAKREIDIGPWVSIRRLGHPLAGVGPVANHGRLGH
jgi:hypothetical protein